MNCWQPRALLLVLLYRTGILSVVTARLCCDDALGLTDAAAVPIVAAGWSIQEWAIHKYLLHGMKVYIP